MWIFFNVLILELHNKFKWIMFFTCKASIAWPNELILLCKFCLSWTCFVGWRTCSKPYMLSLVKAWIDTWNSTSLLRSWRFKVISCRRMWKQSGFLCGNLQKRWWMHTTLWWSRWPWILLVAILPGWILMRYWSPLWANILVAIVRGGEHLNEIGLSSTCFYCWLWDSNQALWSIFVFTFCGP
jgi:hypothetical protein